MSVQLDGLLMAMSSISLEEMGAVRLMNRTDTKFVTTMPRLLRLLGMASSEYRVQEVDGIRNIPYYTLYFDTQDDAMFRVHQAGHWVRQKVRMRSYVNSHLNFLEVKTKNNHKRTKKRRMALEDFMLEDRQESILFRSQDERYKSYESFLCKTLKYDPRTLVEAVENRFHRITLVNRAMTERLTIDQGLQFHCMQTDGHAALENVVVIELKRDGTVASPVLKMLRELHIHQQGFSKYCVGRALTNHTLRINRLKERLRMVDRMECSLAV